MCSGSEVCIVLNEERIYHRKGDLHSEGPQVLDAIVMQELPADGQWLVREHRAVLNTSSSGLIIISPLRYDGFMVEAPRDSLHECACPIYYAIEGIR